MAKIIKFPVKKKEQTSKPPGPIERVEQLQLRKLY
jgi:hypothetical protein